MTPKDLAGSLIKQVNKPRNEQYLHSLASRTTKADFRKITSARLLAAREMNGMSQTQAAKKLGYRNSTQLSQWEQGKRQAPVGHILKASGVYRVSLDYLFGACDEPDRSPDYLMAGRVMETVGDVMEEHIRQVATLMVASMKAESPSLRAVEILAHAGDEFASAVDSMIRANRDVFDDMAGGARVERLLGEFTDAIAHARGVINRQAAANKSIRKKVADSRMTSKPASEDLFSNPEPA